MHKFLPNYQVTITSGHSLIWIYSPMHFHVMLTDLFQVTLPANLLCFDLLSFIYNRGDGRFVLKKRKIQHIYVKFTFKSNLVKFKIFNRLS